MGQRIETFIIHLARATGRRKQVNRLLKASPYPARIFEAVDGAKVPIDVRAANIANEPLFGPPYPFTLGPGEYGCFQSHRKVWQTIIDEGLDAALIVEDDVAFDDTFAPAVALVEQHIATFGYIQFQVRPVPTDAVVSQSASVSIVQPRITPLRTSAQMVSRAAAQTLLDMTQQIDRPVDTFLQSYWHTGLRLCCVVPSGVSDRTQETGGSTISSKRSILEKVKRAVERGRYRRAVKRLSQ